MSLAKLSPRKLEPQFINWSFSLRMCFISINLPPGLIQNTAIISEPLTPNCYLNIMDKLRKWRCKAVGSTLAISFENLKGL